MMDPMTMGTGPPLSPTSAAATVCPPGTEHTGRWSKEEHERFLTALRKYGKAWVVVAAMVKTRTAVQTRTHAQKYFQKLEKLQTTTASGSGSNDEDGSNDDENVKVTKTPKRRKLSSQSEHRYSSYDYDDEAGGASGGSGGGHLDLRPSRGGGYPVRGSPSSNSSFDGKRNYDRLQNVTPTDLEAGELLSFMKRSIPPSCDMEGSESPPFGPLSNHGQAPPPPPPLPSLSAVGLLPDHQSQSHSGSNSYYYPSAPPSYAYSGGHAAQRSPSHYQLTQEEVSQTQAQAHSGYQSHDGYSNMIDGRDQGPAKSLTGHDRPMPLNPLPPPYHRYHNQTPPGHQGQDYALTKVEDPALRPYYHNDAASAVHLNEDFYQQHHQQQPRQQEQQVLGRKFEPQELAPDQELSQCMHLHEVVGQGSSASVVG